jgi:RHS repeat-associated protein
VASTWQAGAVTTIEHRGYTGHEHLDDIGVIHMSGRIYSPGLGRMLSPDPVTQAPENGQNYNRYTYVFNNPLRYTDPSGFRGETGKVHCTDACAPNRNAAPGFLEETLVTASFPRRDSNAATLAFAYGGSTGAVGQNEVKESTDAHVRFNNNDQAVSLALENLVENGQVQGRLTNGDVLDANGNVVSLAPTSGGAPDEALPATVAASSIAAIGKEVIKENPVSLLGRLATRVGRIGTVFGLALVSENTIHSLNAGRFDVKNAVDIGFVAVSILPPYGWILSSSYFVVDTMNEGNWRGN